ncbi:MAG: hypothetical protein ACAI37_21390 [Chthoniobacter sp.]
MNTVTLAGNVHPQLVVSSGDSTMVPWLELRSRIREALAQKNFYVANSQDLSLLWSGERIDASERRRRITVFAAQHQWRVEAHPEGTSARFQLAPVSGMREVLSRNHE